MNARIQQRRKMAALFKRAVTVGRLNVLDPEFNFREIAKQMLLLEDHLLHATKHCPDCIRKHLLTIEAFAEEATGLDAAHRFGRLGDNLAEKARQWQAIAAANQNNHALAQDIRKIRKGLVQRFHDPRGPQRIAAVWVARGKHIH